MVGSLGESLSSEFILGHPVPLYQHAGVEVRDKKTTARLTVISCCHLLHVWPWKFIILEAFKRHQSENRGSERFCNLPKLVSGQAGISILVWKSRYSCHFPNFISTGYGSNPQKAFHQGRWISLTQKTTDEEQYWWRCSVRKQRQEGGKIGWSGFEDSE